MGCTGSKKKKEPGTELDEPPKVKSSKTKPKKEKTVLLLGPGESGKSTLFKQLQIIQDSGGYTEAQLREFIPNIRNNIVANMKILLGARSWIKTETDIAEDKMSCVKVLESANLNDWNDAIADAAEKLWAEPAIREIYSKVQIRYKKFSNFQ
jgi:energy-coupling factor transporter ATP-binding protein EcfA2